MPLFTVTMKSNGSTNEKDRLSRAIHAASIAAGYPEDDLFQRFLSLGPSDFRVDLYYPALPRPRTDQMLMIEVLVSSGTDTNRKKVLLPPWLRSLAKQVSTQATSWCFSWRPIARADHSVAAASHHLLPSPDHRLWICELILKNQQPRWALWK
jgi:hypothetical protein